MVLRLAVEGKGRPVLFPEATSVSADPAFTYKVHGAGKRTLSGHESHVPEPLRGGLDPDFKARAAGLVSQGIWTSRSGRTREQHLRASVF